VYSSRFSSTARSRDGCPQRCRKRPADFDLDSTYGDLEIWRNRDRPEELLALPAYSRHRLHDGIDDVFAPQIAPDPD
jgi:hypothetical protein